MVQGRHPPLDHHGAIDYYIGEPEGHIMSNKTSRRKAAFGQWIAVAAASISLIFLIGFGSQIVEIYRLRSALLIADAGVEELRAEHASLEATLAYVQTDDYAERIARAELNKIRPGDQRVVIVTRAAPAPSPVPTPTPTPRPPTPPTSYFDAWWELLFGD
jgi:cell division protein FtsB